MTGKQTGRKRKAEKQLERSDPVAELKRRMESRRSHLERVQAQIPFQDGKTGLYTMRVTSKNNVDPRCLRKVEKFIRAASHPTHGLHTDKLDFRVSEKAYNKIPFNIPASMLKSDGIANGKELFLQNALIYMIKLKRYADEVQYILGRKRKRGEVCAGFSEQNRFSLYQLTAMWSYELPEKVWFFGPIGDAAADRLNEFLNYHKLELPNEEVRVQFVPVTAERGSIVLYTTYHGNLQTENTALVMHGDYLPYKKDAQTRQWLTDLYQIRQDAEVTGGSGSGNSPVLANEWHKSSDARAIRLPDDPHSAYALGKEEFPGDYSDVLMEFVNHLWSAKYRDELERNGVVVIPVIDELETQIEALGDADSEKKRELVCLLEEWKERVNGAETEFEDFFNYCLFGRYGLDSKLSFKSRDSDLWNILSGKADCERLMKDKNFLNLAKKDGDGVWKHSGTAQGGQSLVTIQCGMGLATNLYQGYHSLRLWCHPMACLLFKQVYGAEDVLNCCERWRVKVGTGKPTPCIVNIRQRGVMPPHCDTLPNVQ